METILKCKAFACMSVQLGGGHVFFSPSIRDPAAGKVMNWTLLQARHQGLHTWVFGLSCKLASLPKPRAPTFLWGNSHIP